MQLSDKKRALLEKLMQEEGLDSSSQQSITRIEHNGVAPMSFSQDRLWFLNQMQPESPVYNFPTAVRLIGALQVPALKRGLNKIFKRHDILRATFTSGDQGPVQNTIPELELNLAEINLDSLPKSERLAEAFRFANDELQQPFNLEKAPLLRAYLIRLSADDAIFLLINHHIIAEC